MADLRSHLGLEPGLQVSAVLGSNVLVVISDLGHNCRQILLRSSIHLHVHLTAHLGALREQVLQKKKASPVMQRWSFNNNSCNKFDFGS